MTGLRVISGKARGRKLRSVPGETTRPITDRVKESLFDILGADVQGSRILDLFAGTGSVGIEALSRGAQFVRFVERDRAAADIVRVNLVSVLGINPQAVSVIKPSLGIKPQDMTGRNPQAISGINPQAVSGINPQDMTGRNHQERSGSEIIRMDAFNMLERPGDQNFDYIYIAPPQYKGLWKRALLSLDAHTFWLSEDAWIIVQIHPKEYESLDMQFLVEFDQRKYGSTLLVFYRKIMDNRDEVDINGG